MRDGAFLIPEKKQEEQNDLLQLDPSVAYSQHSLHGCVT